MTVKELIEYLQACPQDAEVLTADSEDGYCVIKQEDILNEENVTVGHGAYGGKPYETFKQAIILQ